MGRFVVSDNSPERRIHLLPATYPIGNTHAAYRVVYPLYTLLFLLCTASTSLAETSYLQAQQSTAPHEYDLAYQNPLDSLLETLFSKKGRKDPALSLLLAAAPPLLSIQGLGQIYNGDVGKGLLFFGIGQVSIGTWSTAVDQKTARIARTLYMASWIWSTVDAYRSAKQINRRRGHGAGRPYWNRKMSQPLHAFPLFAPPINRPLTPRSNRADKAQTAHNVPR